MDALLSLEWDRFLDLAEEFARTEPGCDRIQDLFEPELWAQDLDRARELQQETLEMLGLVDRDALWGPINELADPFSVLEALDKGAVLEVERLAHLRRWLYAIDSWVATPKESFQGELFKKAISSLMDPREPIRVLDRILTPEGQLSERASPRLAQLFAEIRAVRKEITTQLERVLSKYSQKGVLQESFSDVHDGRYVVPVKISSQSDVEGNIYGTSSSRQTVFIEPAEIAPLNNRLRSRENELTNEIYAILEAASKQLRPFVTEMGDSFETIAYWDAVQAKARFSRNYGGRTLIVGDGSDFRLKQTAHPLLFWSLAPEKITRNDIEWGDPVRTLLLTGPNTGGKTVLLKTLGLAGICARTGFPFPGADEQVVPYFDHFFVDVGDAQSIEQHLSSFSGHIERFKKILNEITEDSLVLLDELNSATDPTEGAALGRAFLETVMARGALVVATTHDPQLKALALNDERIMNASMAFDERSRSPTFTMVLGVPGRSRALETAERLGLPAEVLSLARSYLTDEHNRFENMLARMEKDADEATKARKEAAHLREEAERLKREWTERTEKNVSEMMERTRQKLRKILEQAQDEVRSQVKRLDELKSRKEIDTARGSLNQAFTLSADRIESALKEEAPEIAASLDAARGTEAASLTKTYAVGETVRIPKWKNLGQILEIAGSKVKVQMGALQINLSLDDIDKTTDAEARIARAQKPKSAPKTVQIHDRPPAPDSRIDLRGQRYEEAMSKLESYLDVAYRSGGLAEVTIVHGLGTGALREGTVALLKSLPYVKTFRDGGVGMGGAGATIVEFEQ